MTITSTARPALLAGALLLAGLALPAPASQAASCAAPLRYASSSNTLYVGAGDWTLTEIKAACSTAPLDLVDPATGTWLLRGDLVVEAGGHLVLHGSQAAVPGDVNTLRLRSRASNLKTEVSQLRANHGWIDADSVTVTSWDDIAGAPDTNYSLPSGSPSGSRARAFVRVNSFLQSGVARESRLDIRNARFEYLGYNAAESYGVSYKTIGCDRTPANFPTCDLVTVTGDQVDSVFRANFIGTYVWGGSDMTFSGSRYVDNVSYGLDPHDVSRNLVVTGNEFVNNGNHGFICSQRCDNLTITDNLAQDNGTPPYLGSSAQVHGIMLHRGVTNTVVANNTVLNHPTGGGIAIFDSVGNVIRDNVITGAKYGLRVSVGSMANTFQDNVVEDSSQYAAYLYKGSDTPMYSATSGRPTANTFVGNTFDGTGSSIVKLSSAQDTVFEDNVLAGAGAGVYADSSPGTVFRANDYPSFLIFSTAGTGAVLTIAELDDVIKVAARAGHTIRLTDSAGAVFDVRDRDLATTVGTSSSRLDLTSATLGTTGTVTVERPVSRLTLGTGTGSAEVNGLGTGNGQSVSLGTAAPTTATLTIGGLTPGRQYRVLRDGVELVADVTADAAGRIVVADPATVAPGPAGYVPEALP